MDANQDTDNPGRMRKSKSGREQSTADDNKDPSILSEVEIIGSENEPQARIVRHFSLGVADLSGLHYDPSAQRLHSIIVFISLSLRDGIMFSRKVALCKKQSEMRKTLRNAG